MSSRTPYSALVVKIIASKAYQRGRSWPGARLRAALCEVHAEQQRAAAGAAKFRAATAATSRRNRRMESLLAWWACATQDAPAPGVFPRKVGGSDHSLWSSPHH